jgi:hypothetical protein
VRAAWADLAVRHGQHRVPALHNERVRFEVSRVLDAIERRLSTDPVIASGLVDLTEVVRFADLDGGRPANLLRLGLLVDALAQRLGDSSATLYAVADRALISDTELTSNERMVIRRWSDDGLIEVLPAGTPVVPRVREVSALTGLPMITRMGGASPAYAPVPVPGGVMLSAHAGQPPPPAATRTNPLLARVWQCGEFDCPSFGPGHAGGQPPPTVRGGVPTCPRHGTRLVDAGPRPLAVPLAARIDGLVRERFVVTTAQPVLIGRAPEAGGVAVGPYLDEAGIRWVSRTHARLELRDGVLTITDASTNGTTILVRSGPAAAPQSIELTSGQSRQLGEWDIISLFQGVEIARADRLPARPPAVTPDSVMADAPTMSLRVPPQ